MRTKLLLGIVLCSITVGSAAVAQELPAEITALYQDLGAGIETGDLQALEGHLTGMAALEALAPNGTGFLPDAAALQKSATVTAAEVQPQLLRQTDDWALLRVAYRLEGRKADGGDPWQETRQYLDLLRRTDAGWQLFASRREDPVHADYLEGGAYEDPDLGVSAQVPADWTSAVVIGQGGSDLVAVPPTLGAYVELTSSALPVALTAKEIATSASDAVQQLAPELQLQVLAEGPTTLGGLEAYRRSEQLQAGGAPLRTDSVMAVKGLTLYAFAALAGDSAVLEALGPALDGIEQSIAITGRETVAVPEGLGRVQGQTYNNDNLGCRITAPDGWTISVNKGQSNLELQVVMAEPDGESTFLFATADLSAAPGVTAEQAVHGDDVVSQQLFQDLRIHREGPLKLAGLDAYESVTEFTLQGRSRGRWRVYATDGNLLYVLMGEAVPSDRWQKLEPTFQGIVDSFRVGP